MSPLALAAAILAQQAPALEGAAAAAGAARDAAPADAAPTDAGGPSLLLNVVMFGSIFAIFYFLLIRPQQQQEKARRAMLDAVKRKDRVVTSGGLLGVVSDIRDDELVLRIAESPDVKVRVRRTAIVEVLKEAGETPAA
jgi:preprotein translocase subunit YajC